MRFFPLLFIFFLASICIGQNAPQLFELKITPTSILNPYRPTLLCGAEIYVSKKVSAQFEYGFQSPPIFSNHFIKNKKDWRYQKIKTEVKFKLRERGKYSSFWGFGLMQISQKYRRRSGDIVTKNGTEYRYSRILLERNGNVFFSNLYLKRYFGKRFFMEAYLGLGLKKRTLNIIRMDNPRTPPQSSSSIFDVFDSFKIFDFGLEESDDVEGSDSVPFIDGGVKVGIYF